MGCPHHIVNLRPVLKGKSFRGVNFSLLDANNDPIDLTSATVYMKFISWPDRLDEDAPNALLLSSADEEQITVDVNTVTVHSFIMELPAGVYYYEIYIAYSITSITPYVGGSITVKTSLE